VTELCLRVRLVVEARWGSGLWLAGTVEHLTELSLGAFDRNLIHVHE
jgi:hypothetical protein